MAKKNIYNFMTNSFKSTFDNLKSNLSHQSSSQSLENMPKLTISLPTIKITL